MLRPSADVKWSYDGEGRVVWMKYPSKKKWIGHTPVTTDGPTVNYQFDSMARMTGVTETLGGQTKTLISAMLYNAHGAMTQMKHHGNGGATVTQTESREYNILGQLTRISAGAGGGNGAVDLNYTYSTTQNNGKITQLVNAVSGETVVYQYDSLQRLTSAVKTGGSAPWSTAYAYDGWGNLTQMGASSYGVDPGTNRLTGVSFDANGNQLNGSTSAYDIENRLLKWDASGEEYRYGPDNRRVFKRTSTVERYYFIGLNGRVASEMEVNWEENSNTPGMLLSPVIAGTPGRWNRYVGLRRVGEGSVGVDDHLGGGAGAKPYGEQGGRFGTHDQDSSTGLHYADQRYYYSNRGRFLTADPYRGSRSVDGPASWNRYSYVFGDPVRSVDPRGLYCVSLGDGLYTDDGQGPAEYSCDNSFGSHVVSVPSAASLLELRRLSLNNTLEAPLEPSIEQTSFGPTDLREWFKEHFCPVLPIGRAYGVTGSAGGISGDVASLEIVINYQSGNVSLFGSGGVQLGATLGGTAGLFSGFIFSHDGGGLGADNSGYLGGFVGGSLSFGAGLSGGALGAVSSAGQADLFPTSGVSLIGASVGLGYTALPGALTVNQTQYVLLAQLGNVAGTGLPFVTPMDLSFIASWKACR
ncbi:MAG: RHS repeat-associated core domain-containing protein [Bryobacteraceae bacterium]